MRWKLAAASAALAAAALAIPTGAGATTAPTAAPKGFLPSSTSWLNANHGFVLGYTDDLSKPYLLETWNGGRDWQRLGAPAVPLPDTHTPVTVSFGNLAFGILSDGQNAYSTIDHGIHWRHLSIVDPPKGRARVVETVSYGSHFYAIVSGVTDSGQGNSVSLYSAPFWSAALRPVAGVTYQGDTAGDITTKGGLAVTLGGSAGFTSKLWTARDGVHFTAGSAPCVDSFTPTLGGSVRGHRFALCTGDSGWSESTKQVTTTDRQGVFEPMGMIAPRPGFSSGVGVASPTTTVVGAAAGTTWLYATFDAGTSWTTVLQNGPERPITGLSFSTAKVGTVVIGAPDWGPAALYRTTDGGHTWTPLSF